MILPKFSIVFCRQAVAAVRIADVVGGAALAVRHAGHADVALRLERQVEVAVRTGTAGYAWLNTLNAPDAELDALVTAEPEVLEDRDVVEVAARRAEVVGVKNGPVWPKAGMPMQLTSRILSPTPLPPPP